MSTVRPAAVAGMFYPGSSATLRQSVRDLLDSATGGPVSRGSWPKALIVPHAGYIYSGPVAARAYARLSPGRNTIRRVVLLGPVHRVPVRGLALPGAGAFVTPLGSIQVDLEAVASIRHMPQVCESAAAHALEHSLEVQLPFLQSVLDDFAIVPLAVGDASAEEVAEVIERLWGGAETLIVVSSDLSHYHEYGAARRIDLDTTAQIAALSHTLDHEQACGATPINGFSLCAQRRGLTPDLIALCNSGDTAGDKSRVVGYASFAFDESRPEHSDA